MELRPRIAKHESLYRFVPALVALCLFAALSALYLRGDKETYFSILRHFGIQPFKMPFIDTTGELAAWECTRSGVPVIVHDPCDVLDRAFNYSPMWLAGSFIPLGVSATGPVGFGLDLIFLLSLTLVPPARRLNELMLVVLATVSTMVVYAVERANPDILLFMLALAAGFLTLGPRAARLLAYCVALFAAALKYYPIALFVLTFKERLAVFLSINLVAAALIGLFVGVYLPQLELGIPLIPDGGYFMDRFGAKNLPLGLAELFLSHGHAPQSGFLAYDLLVAAIASLMVLGFVFSCRWLLKATALPARLGRLTRQESLFLLIGSALISACFFAGQSIDYRGVYLLLVLPGLLALARDDADPAFRKLFLRTAVLLVLVMWGELAHAGLSALQDLYKGTTTGDLVMAVTLLLWLVRELAWWWLIGVMTAVVLHFVASSEALGDAVRLWKRYRVPAGAKPGSEY